MVDKLNTAVALSHILAIPLEKSKKMIELTDLSEYMSIIDAIEDQDEKTIEEIYAKYEKRLKTASIDKSFQQEIKDFYNAELKLTKDHQEALARTADQFGIKGEEVEEVVGAKESIEYENKFDKVVIESIKGIKQILSGGQVKQAILKEMNTRQRWAMYKQLPDKIANYIKNLDNLTPIEVMQKHAEVHGFQSLSPRQYNNSLENMKEEILKKELKGRGKDEEIDLDAIYDYRGMVDYDDYQTADEVVKEQEINENVDSQAGVKNLIQEIKKNV